MTANAIIECALEYHVDVIVFEHLDMKGKSKAFHFVGKKQGSKRQRLHLWRKQAVQAMVTHKAHREGIRISRVNPKYTSALANSTLSRFEFHRRWICFRWIRICTKA